MDTTGCRALPDQYAMLVETVRCCMQREVRPADDKLPHAAVLGDQGARFAIAEEWLVHARVPYAAAGIGVTQAALDLALGWARQRKTFGSLLADMQAIQWMLADSQVDLRAARLLVYQAAWNGDHGRDNQIDASVGNLFATEAAGRGSIAACRFSAAWA